MVVIPGGSVVVITGSSVAVVTGGSGSPGNIELAAGAAVVLNGGQPQPSREAQPTGTE